MGKMHAGIRVEQIADIDHPAPDIFTHNMPFTLFGIIFSHYKYILSSAQLSTVNWLASVKMSLMIILELLKITLNRHAQTTMVRCVHYRTGRQIILCVRY